jgi:hypothetical protein
MLNYRTDRENVLKFLRKTNIEVGQALADMRQDFEKNPPVPSSIKERLSVWKVRYMEVLNACLAEFVLVGEGQGFEFKGYLGRITEEYGNEQEFNELLKTLNGTIENLKELIRVNLLKDPSIYYIKE